MSKQLSPFTKAQLLPQEETLEIYKKKGNLFIGGMVLKHLNRLVIENNKVIKEERLLNDKGWRVRSVKQGPDGYLYIGVDGGKILRIMPN